MKPDSVEFLKGCAWVAAIFALTLLLWLVSTPARAADIVITGENCKMDERGLVCEYPVVAVDRLIRSNNNHWQETQRLAQALKDRAEQGPKCAEVTVTEPSKAPKIVIPREPVDGGRS